MMWERAAVKTAKKQMPIYDEGWYKGWKNRGREKRQARPTHGATPGLA
jgi:hypothetical protein